MTAAILNVKAYIDISKFWQKNNVGEPKSVNSVYEELRGTDLALTRNTLKQALEGELDRAHLTTQIKLARLVSKWAGRQVTIDELLKVEDDDNN